MIPPPYSHSNSIKSLMSLSKTLDRKGEYSKEDDDIFLPSFLLSFLFLIIFFFCKDMLLEHRFQRAFVGSMLSLVVSLCLNSCVFLLSPKCFSSTVFCAPKVPNHESRHAFSFQVPRCWLSLEIPDKIRHSSTNRDQRQRRPPHLRSSYGARRSHLIANTDRPLITEKSCSLAMEARGRRVGFPIDAQSHDWMLIGSTCDTRLLGRITCCKESKESEQRRHTRGEMEDMLASCFLLIFHN